MKEITVVFSQTLRVLVPSDPTVEQAMEAIKQAVDNQLYPVPYAGNHYLEFVVHDCPEMPELIDEMID